MSAVLSERPQRQLPARPAPEGGKPARLRDWTGPAPQQAAAYIAPPVIPVRTSHGNRALMWSFLLVVLLPCLLAGAYLFLVAEDRYASQAGFTIRQEEGGAASDLLGGMSQLLGGSSGGHADLLFEYLRSQDLVLRLDARFGLRAHYALHHARDPLFSLPPEGTVDQLTRYWSQVLRVAFDRNTGLLLLEIRANDPEFARLLAQAVVEESERMINQLNAQARRDRMQMASADLGLAEARLRAAREALAAFRASTQMVDPDADIQGRMGVLNNLQQQLAQGLVEHDLLAMITDPSDPRLRQAQRRIEVVRARITEERQTFAQEDATVAETDYPRLIARYESLRADQEMAEQGYAAAIRAHDMARSQAERQSLYLALFIPPTLSEEPGHPRRALLLGLTALFAVLIWAFGALAWQSLRDRN
jgi:capsular polysaccharide transport system permease protein